MIPTIKFNNKKYPAWQAEGNAAQFAIPYALKVCNGIGYDIGYSNDDWKFPGAIGIDPKNDPRFHANQLPEQTVNYIFSSHCLEHVDDWVGTLDYWIGRLSINGVLFLYLPDYSQEYWRPFHNRKHKHIFTPQIITDYFISKQMENIFASGVDLNNSFMVFGEKTIE